MTTKSSPLRVLKAQADRIAKTVKASERGEFTDAHFAQRIIEAREKTSVKFGIVMDDKVITIDLTWEKIRQTSEVGLSEYFLKLMREERNAS